MTPNVAEACVLVENAEDYTWFDVSGHEDVSSTELYTVFQQPPPFDKTAIVMAGDAALALTVWTYHPETNLACVQVTLREVGIVFRGEYSVETRSWLKMDRFSWPEDTTLPKIGITMVALLQNALNTELTYGVATANPTNKRRVSRHKKPLYDWHTVVLEPKAPKAEPQGGTHASPRRHSCRGHWRNLRSGRQVWVKDHWKGDASKGTVFKDYIVKQNTNVLDSL